MSIAGSIDDVLDDLFARFVMNLPREEIISPARLGFQLEQAWWFYDDFFRAENSNLPKMNLKRFIQCLLSRYPEWTTHHGIDIEELITSFLKYKAQVPTCGAILIDETLSKCLMVQGWNSGTWTFPKGKIAKGELPEQCAVREVEEEIGYNIDGKFSPNDYIQTETGPHAVRLYLVPMIPESTQFQTMTRKEIGAIKWFNIAELSDPKSPNRFFNVNTFLGRLKAFVKRQKKALLGVVTADDDLPPVLSSQPAKTKSKKKEKKSADASLKQTPVKQDNKKKKILSRPVQPSPSTNPSVFSLDYARIEAAFLNAWNLSVTQRQ